MSEDDVKTLAGSEKTREFYDRVGWTKEDGILKDRLLFGARKAGPLKQSIHLARTERLVAAMAQLGAGIRMLECGCGGNPETAFLHLCKSYTGVDFSATGLGVAAEALSRTGIPFELKQADICKLPFAEGAFDAVYSAHAIYHIPDPEAQAAAYREALRVVRPGGMALFVMANPFPLAFPFRLLRRCLAVTPVLGKALDALRRKPPLPYLPMPLGWTRRILEEAGEVRITSYAMPSTWFAQNVSEQGWPGRMLWSWIGHAEERWPRLSAHLGNYVCIMVRKHVG